MVVVLNAVLQKQEDVTQLAQLEDELRLRLSAQAAGIAGFDWDVAAGTIHWDGATDILPLHFNAGDAKGFLEGVLQDRRGEIQALLDSRDPGSAPFLIDLEIASALGAMTFTMSGTRFSGEPTAAPRA